MAMETRLGREAWKARVRQTGKCCGDKYDQSASNNESNVIVKRAVMYAVL